MSKKGKSEKLQYPGKILTADRMKVFINHIIDSNNDVVEMRGEGKKVPICIWGKHGIGKTAIPEQIARERGIGFKKISPAQFEEMGDLMGMPGTGYYVVKEGQSKLVNSDLVEAYEMMGWKRDVTKPSQTITSAPEWVPNPDLGDNPKGIFCIDDFNRADGRIINGTMDLMQNGGLAGWKLPEGWTIILTANPPGGSYQVKELDDAQMTRMTHLSMQFDAKLWGQWASKNGVDGRVINFIMKYPELVKDGELTIPRSLEYFSNNIRRIKDLKANLDMVLVLSHGSLDEEAAIAFTGFINDNLTTLVTPEEILAAKKFETEIEPQITPFSKSSTPRVDVLSILANRLVWYCIDSRNGDLNKDEINNVKAFINMKHLPNDIRLNMAQDLVRENKLKAIMADPEIGKLLLKKM